MEKEREKKTKIEMNGKGRKVEMNISLVNNKNIGK